MRGNLAFFPLKAAIQQARHFNTCPAKNPESKHLRCGYHEEVDGLSG